MKGLFIKDLALLKNQGKIIFIALVISLIYLFVDVEGFSITFLALMGMLIGISTIAYDENDNGGAYLFSMPFTVKQYCVEKYLFVFGGMLFGALFGYAVSIGSILLGKSGATYASLFETFIVAIGLFGFMESFLLPLNLGFGPEKGRNIAAVIAGLFLAAVFLFRSFAGNIPVPEFITKLQDVPDFVFTTVTIAGAAVMLTVSFIITNTIMRKKEF